MRRPRHLLALLACGAAALSAPPPAAAQRTILTGSDTAVWLVRVDEVAGTFDLSVRQIDGTFQWVASSLSGRPVAAVAAAKQLHMLFSDPAGHVAFDEDTHDQSAALNPEHPLWPAGAAPEALCEAPDPNGAAGRTILAVVVRPAGPSPAPPADSQPAGASPASAPTSSPAWSAGPAVAAAGPRDATGRFDLGLFRRVGAGWVHLVDWPNRRLDPGARAFVAAAGPNVYLLVSDGRANRLARWNGEALAELQLTGVPATAPAVGMLAVGGRLVLLLGGPAEDLARRELLLATFDPDKLTFALLTATAGNEPATWPANALPEVARLGEQLALLWTADGNATFATCLPHVGQLTTFGPVDVFDRSPLDETGEDAITYFMWAIMAAVFIPMFLLRPRGGPTPFVLPETLRVGNLGKRLLAALIDLAPINLLVSSAFTLTTSSAKREEIQRLLEQVLRGKEVRIPIEIAIVYIATLLLYVLYCTAMEARLGATLGKMLMKLRVVGNEGKPAGLRQCLLRNLLKIIELVSLRSVLFFLVFVIPLLTRYRQRLGDLLARTTVVDSRAVPPPLPPSAPPEPPDDGAPPQDPTDHIA